MMKLAIKTALAAVCFAALSPAASAAVSLSNTPAGSTVSPFGIEETATYGQVFTAPVTGKLTSFSLSLEGGVDRLYGAVGTWNGTATHGFGFGSPITLYKSADVDSIGAATYTFSPNIEVTAGERYVAYLSTFGVFRSNGSTAMPMGTETPGLDYFVWNNTSNPDGNSSWNYFFNAGDALFSVSFVAAVPEPSTWIMMIAGFGLIGGAMRRQRAKTQVKFAFGQ